MACHLLAAWDRWNPATIELSAGDSSDRLGSFALSDHAGMFRRAAPTPTQLTFGPLAFYIGAITPDGKKLLVAGRQSRGELVRYDSTSKQFVPFLGGMNAYAVSFSRDGKRIAYVDATEETLWISRRDGSEKVQLTYAPHRRPDSLFSFKALNLYITPELVPWNDSTPEGSRMFLHDVSTEDYYALDVDFP